MTQKLIEAAQQALEALEKTGIEGTWLLHEEAITALREALAKQAEQEPVAWLIPGTVTGDKKLAEANGTNAIPLYTSPVEQKPIGEVYQEDYGLDVALELPLPPSGTKLYAAPVRTKDLTDDEIHNIRWHKATDIDFARAVIAADREKNNGC